MDLRASRVIAMAAVLGVLLGGGAAAVRSRRSPFSLSAKPAIASAVVAKPVCAPLPSTTTLRSRHTEFPGLADYGEQDGFLAALPKGAPPRIPYAIDNRLFVPARAGAAARQVTLPVDHVMAMTSAPSGVVVQADKRVLLVAADGRITTLAQGKSYRGVALAADGASVVYSQGSFSGTPGPEGGAGPFRDARFVRAELPTGKVLLTSPSLGDIDGIYPFVRGFAGDRVLASGPFLWDLPSNCVTMLDETFSNPIATHPRSGRVLIAGNDCVRVADFRGTPKLDDRCQSISGIAPSGLRGAGLTQVGSGPVAVVMAAMAPLPGPTQLPRVGDGIAWEDEDTILVGIGPQLVRCRLGTKRCELLWAAPPGGAAFSRAEVAGQTSTL